MWGFSFTDAPTFLTAFSVYAFKEVYQRTNFNQIMYKASSGMEGERMHVFFFFFFFFLGGGGGGGWLDWNFGVYRRIMGKLQKSSSLKRRDPQLIDLCLGSFVISVLFLLCFRARMFIDALWSPSGKGLTSWLAFVMSYCEVVTFPLVSWIRCGAWLYRFLIFALFLLCGHLHKSCHPCSWCLYTSHGVILASLIYNGENLKNLL